MTVTHITVVWGQGFRSRIRLLCRVRVGSTVGERVLW